MASINTNLSALTALAALRNTQGALSTTQKQLATGLKISTAADGSSTFSIAETMKSDQGALTTIGDALSVSSQAIQVAGKAVTDAINVVNRIKTNITDAYSVTSDQNQILTTLTTLGNSLKSIVTSAGFNGLNLLDGSRSTVKLISSYTDTALNGGTGIGTIDVSATKVLGGGTGIVDGGSGTNLTGLALTDLSRPGSATVTGNTITAPNKIGTAVFASSASAYTLTLNGTAISIAASASESTTINAINALSSTTGVTASDSAGSVKLSSNSLNGFTVSGGGSTLLIADGTYSNLGANQVGVTAGNLTLNGTAIALVATDSSASVLSKINAQTATTNVVASYNSTNQLVLSSNNSASFTIAGTAGTLTDLGQTAGTIALTGGTGQINTTLTNVDKALSSLRTYASQLGAVQAQVDSQKTFVKSLNEALTAGVGALVDADLNEVSAKLQALQTQQQLGVQALSIANSNSQLILKLFQ